MAVLLLWWSTTQFTKTLRTICNIPLKQCHVNGWLLGNHCKYILLTRQVTARGCVIAAADTGCLTATELGSGAVRWARRHHTDYVRAMALGPCPGVADSPATDSSQRGGLPGTRTVAP